MSCTVRTSPQLDDQKSTKSGTKRHLPKHPHFQIWEQEAGSSNLPTPTTVLLIVPVLKRGGAGLRVRLPTSAMRPGASCIDGCMAPNHRHRTTLGPCRWGSGGIVVEVEPAEVEAFAERVLPGASGGRRWCPRWLGSGSARGEQAPVGIGEADAAFDIGVALDPQPTLVVETVVARAEADEVPRIGGAVAAPVDDVVDFDEAVVEAPGDAAAAVAVFDDAAGAFSNDVL